MNTADLIWLNGEFVAWEDAKVHVLTHAMHYGTGVFEGIRAYETERGPAIFRHQDHLNRLEASAKLYYMDLPFAKEQLREVTHELIVRNGFKSCYIRPLVWRGYGPMGLNPLENPVEAMIAVWEWGAYLGEEGKRNGVRARVSSYRRISSDSLIPHSKASGQYLNSVLAKIESIKAGYEEAILLDDKGRVCEGTGENVFVIKDGVIYTPPQTAGHPRRHQPQVVHPDRARPRLRAGRARHRARRAGAGRRGLPDRHRRRADAAARDRRHRDRRGHARARSRARSRSCSTTPCTAAPRSTRSGWTWCRCRRRRKAAESAGDKRNLHGGSEGASPQMVSVYDTTLRDGMQGEGMSLSVDEKVRVAHALDSLGVHLIEAGFPASNPKEEALFELLAGETFETAEVAAFGMTRRRDSPPRTTRRCGCSPTRFAPVCTLVGKTWSLHLEKVTQVEPEENLRMIADSVGFLRGAGQARGLRRRALLRRLPRRPRLRPALPAGGRRGGRGERDALRHQRLVAARAGGRGRRRAWSRELGDTVAGRHPHPRRRRLRRGQHAGRRRGGRAPGAGHDERLRRALRQRQPRHDRPDPRAEDGLRVHRRATGCGA